MSGRRDHDDKLLVEAFRTLRERERGRAPSFERVLARQTGRPPARRWAPALLAAALLLLAVGVWRGAGDDRDVAVAFQIRAGDLRTPTDFLLDLSAADLPGVPRFGRSDDWFKLPALDESDTGPTDESERL